MTDLATRRKDLLSSSMDNIRAIIANQGETRAALKDGPGPDTAKNPADGSDGRQCNSGALPQLLFAI